MSKQLKVFISIEEAAVLRSLGKLLKTDIERQFGDVSQIAQESGIRDIEEVLRALYHLEGKSLVSPDPVGDFTSNHWKITDVGIQALEVIA